MQEHRGQLESLCAADGSKLSSGTKSSSALMTSINWTNENHRYLVRSLIMTSADMCGNAKPYRQSERIAKMLAREFYAQGDREREMGQRPLPLMNREKIAALPELQVQFLRIVGLPCFSLLKRILPKTDQLYVNCK